ncbi:hypothetical protein SAMN04488498_102424 [Mesorhizobium albiziae]|uniref:Helix-turn-helix domain-containing protein n=1 Tax=Neomesorhizobium albiziae TaxID=335020 RepID=A0A1I3WTS3_9HYPH|nr:hypothetical protein [Mesorhizobium albiziae]GLS31820.1 hypothetical protein GCM10007937_35300 [Mesorhizobium albiziae]SFK09841.1 hypothetical protein SAMN04488498_102424 [Mesorhizobium albiziae]
MNQILISHYSPWSPTEVKELKCLAAARMPVGAIANKLGRTPPAIRAKARLERITLFDDHGIRPSSRTENRSSF